MANPAVTDVAAYLGVARGLLTGETEGKQTGAVALPPYACPN
jgi:hypothetical protein